MKNANGRLLSLATLATLILLATCGVAAFGQDSPAINVGDKQLRGLPEDWTHHRLVFSNPGSEEEATRNGTHDTWMKIVNEPRYVMQQVRRNLGVQGPAAPDAAWFEQVTKGSGGVLEKAEPPLRLSPVQDLQTAIANAKKSKGKISKDWNEALGSATAPSNVAYPAKWSFYTTSASCSNDFVIYPTGQAGSSTRASIVAYYNMYVSGCSGTVPEVDWAYNTGGTVSLSPVFSLGGNQIAFIQSSSSVASLVLLTYPLTPPGTGSVTAPTTLTAVAASAYPGCHAPCMTTIALNGSPNDTASNPFYDYGTDTLYVGDSVGKLHKFTPVFNGTPAEVTTPWPVQLKNTANDTNQAASPVYDPSSGYVFVGTTSITTSTGGVLYSVGTGNQGTSSGSIHGYSGELDAGFGLLDSPLLDSTAGKVYVFAGYDSSSSHNNGVFQFATNFTTGSGTEATLGSGSNSTTVYQFTGTFDNTYYSSSNGSSPSGYLYVCGTAAGAPLYQVAISSDVMSTVVTGPTISDSSKYYGRCSPVSEFFNPSVGGTDATQTGTFTGNPGGGQTATIGGTEILTASVGTPATATVTVGASTCFQPGSGVSINSTTVTTNATEATATYVFSTSALPSSGSQVTIGGTTYTFETTLTGSTANQVLIGAGGTGGTRTQTNAEETARNLSVAINNTDTCGYPSSGSCTRNVSAANAEVSSTNTTGTATETMTALCANNAAITNSGTTNVTVNSLGAGTVGTTSASSRTFALGTTNGTTSNTAAAANISTVINGNSTLDAAFSSTAPSNVVNISTVVWSTAGNSDTLALSGTSTGVTLSGSTFANGTSGTNSGTDFAIDNVLADEATNLAAAITRNGGSVGVGATASGAVVTVSATTVGTSGNSITLADGLSNFSWAGTDLAGGTSGTDYLFMSVFAGTESGCTDGTTSGCLMSFDITSPSGFSSSSTPVGTFNLSAVEYGSPTGGIIVDNGVATPAGTSQIYFVTQSTVGASPCTGICAVQDSQTNP